METISLITICLGFGFIWFVTFVHPPTHRILRAKKTYNLFLYFSILSPIISIIIFNSQMLQNQKETLFLSLYLLFFLLMYKCCDDYIFKNITVICILKEDITLFGMILNLTRLNLLTNGFNMV